MQSIYPASQPLSAYHSLYHPPLPNHDHELKRTYLGLLPPQQIIEICLTFDLHVSPYIKSTVWPLDLNGAIAGLRKAEQEKDEAKEKETNGVAIMDSLAPEKQRTPTPAPEEPPEKSVEEPRPPDKEPKENGTAAAADQSTNTPAAATSPPQPSAAPPATALSHAYPHQPYGYTYPHAPYYAPPPAYPYAHPQYPAYQYPQAPGYPPPAAYHHPAAPHAHVPPAMQDPGEDLPSYEEMIVEALQEANDPEGCAPKDLFAWMASRYPLQSNFRPSASQALQKAFKRGRLEKGPSNKYKLNPNWEGGSTSRRTTRRPQTQNSVNSQVTSSPFTHAPLVHHHNHTQYPYGYPYSRPQPQPAASTSTQATASTSSSSTVDGAAAKAGDPPEGTSKDAYEAAQSILNAINFGDLLPLAEDEMNANTDTNTQPAASSSTTGAGQTASTVDTGSRAELQAQLVLLATQLTALAKLSDPEAPTPVVTVSPRTFRAMPGITQASGLPSAPTSQQPATPAQNVVSSPQPAQYQSPQFSQTSAQQPPGAQYRSPAPAKSPTQSPQHPSQAPVVHVLQAYQSFSLPYQAPAKPFVPPTQTFSPYTATPPVPQYQAPQPMVQEPVMLGLQPPPPSAPENASTPASAPTIFPPPVTPASITPAPSWAQAAPPSMTEATSAAQPTASLAPVPEVPTPAALIRQPLPNHPTAPIRASPPPTQVPAEAHGGEGDASFDTGSDTESDDDMEEVI